MSDATMVGPFDGESYNTEPGCYVDGSRGIYAIPHMILWQFPGFATVSERRLVAAYERGWSVDGLHEAASDACDAVTGRINDALPPDRLAHWDMGEFYISPMCADGTCGADDCVYCQDW